MTEEIKSDAEEYIRLTHEIDELSAKIKDLKERAKHIKKSLTTKMETRGARAITVSSYGAEITYQKKETLEPLSKKVYTRYFVAKGMDPDAVFTEINQYRQPAERKEFKVKTSKV